MTNLKKLLPGLFFLALLVSFTTAAQTVSSAKATTTNSDTLASTLLWKIEGKDIKTSYLYGTMHILPKKDFQLSESVTDAFKGAEQVVLELDMDDPGLQAEIMQHINMKDGTTLSKLLSESDYKKLDTLLVKNIGAGASVFDSWTPSMVSTLLLKNFIEGEPASFEGTFIAQAALQQKEILGLETVGEQMNLFHQTPYQDQVKDLTKMLNEGEKTRSIYAEMVEMYKQEDIEGLYAFTVKEYNDPEQTELLLDVRNQKWISGIADFAREKSTFFAVGAGHLAGESGVIKLLQKEGYTVSPVE